MCSIYGLSTAFRNVILSSLPEWWGIISKKILILIFSFVVLIILINIHSLQLGEQSVIIANRKNWQNYKITLKSWNKATFSFKCLSFQMSRKATFFQKSVSGSKLYSIGLHQQITSCQYWQQEISGNTKACISPGSYLLTTIAECIRSIEKHSPRHKLHTLCLLRSRQPLCVQAEATKTPVM